MAKLAAAVHVRDPRSHQMVQLDAGTEPEPELAALVTNPDAWEDGKLPTATKNADATATSSDDGQGDGDKPAARKTAAKKPARGRNAAGEGASGE